MEQTARNQVGRSQGGGETYDPADADIRGLIEAMPARAPWVQTYPQAQRSPRN